MMAMTIIIFELANQKSLFMNDLKEQFCIIIMRRSFFPKKKMVRILRKARNPYFVQIHHVHDKEHQRILFHSFDVLLC